MASWLPGDPLSCWFVVVFGIADNPSLPCCKLLLHSLKAVHRAMLIAEIAGAAIRSACHAGASLCWASATPGYGAQTARLVLEWLGHRSANAARVPFARIVLLTQAFGGE